MVSVLESRGYSVAAIKEMKSFNPNHCSEEAKDRRKYGKAGTEIIVASPKVKQGFSLNKKFP